MMATVESYLIKGRSQIRRLAVDPGVRATAAVVAYAAAGFFFSAGALVHTVIPLAMGLICAMTGWRALVMALGSILGCWVFWGNAGHQAMVWAAVGCLAALFLGKQRIVEVAPMLIPAVAGMLVAVTGLIFQIFFRDTTPVSIYLLRVGIAMGSAWLFGVVTRQRDPVADWLAQGAAVLALAQVAPVPVLCFGFFAGGMLSAGGAFPAAALSGLALDLARVTPVPMTAVLCFAYLLRFLPGIGWWARGTGPGIVYILVMGLCSLWDPTPILGLTIGGMVGIFLPPRTEIAHRRGEAGVAQVRLELMAQVLQQTRQILLEAEDPPIDEEALLCRTRERACGGCPNRKQCHDVSIPRELLEKPLSDTGVLGFPCRKPGRMLLELRRTQEQLRALRGDHDRRREYREAVEQQYQFLGAYLQSQADRLPRRGKRLRQRFQPEVAVSTVGKEPSSGDRCIWFLGTECRYYIALCDGMGTGLGAAQEGQTAAALLRQMLTAGFPAEYALRSLNSLLVLRGRAGAVTVDLAEIYLNNGNVTIYKWGAAPSLVLRHTGPEKIGTAGPPPGLSVTQTRETVERLSLRTGEVLMLLSDGVQVGEVLRHGGLGLELPPGELAASVLAHGADGSDDATAAVIRLGTTL